MLYSIFLSKRSFRANHSTTSFAILSCIFTRTNILLLILLLIQGNNAYPLDLVDSYNNALSYNANYLENLASDDASQENQVQAKALLLPQIGVGVTLSENYLNSSGMSIYYHQPSISAGINQVIFDKNKFSSYDKAKDSGELADLQALNAKQKLMLDTVTAYFNVLYANDSLDAIKITKDAFLRQLNEANTNFKAGNVTATDVDDAKAAYDTAVANEISAETDLLNAKTIFYNLTGENADLIQPLINQIKLLHPNPETVDAWTSLAKSNNLEIKIAKKEAGVALEDIAIAKGSLYPKINAYGLYSYLLTPNVDATDSASTSAMISQGAGLPGTFLSSFTLASAGIEINIPIYTGGALNSKVRQNMDSYTEDEEDLVAKEREIDQLTRKTYLDVENGISLVKAEEQNLKSAKLKLQSDQLGYKVGIRDSINLVNAEKTYFEAIERYNQSRYQYLTSQVRLMYLAGIIDLDFLRLIDNNIAR